MFFRVPSPAGQHSWTTSSSGKLASDDHDDDWADAKTRQSWDPTFGYVHYVNQSVADQFHMINISDDTVAWGVDTTQVLVSTG